MNEKDYRDFRVSGISGITAVLSGIAMAALEVPYPFIAVIFFVVLFTTGYLVRLNDKSEAEWQKKMDEKARELKAKRLREEHEESE